MTAASRRLVTNLPSHIFWVCEREPELASVNVQTWLRLRRLELQSTANSLGNAAMEKINLWPSSGEGRAVKAATEKIARLLERTHLRSDVRHGFSVFDEVIEQLRTISANPFYLEHLAPIKVRFRRDEVAFGPLLEGVIGDVASFISENMPPPPVPPAAPSPPSIEARLLRIVPEQKIGPVQFVFKGGVLHILHQAPAAPSEDQEVIGQARDAMVEAGDLLLVDLANSNSDRRLVETVSDMQTRLRTEQDVIQLGIAQIRAQMVCEKFEAELGDVVVGRMQSYNVGLGLYVAQFPAWRKFRENAAEISISPSEIEKTYRSTKALAKGLRHHSLLVDPEVPVSLELISEAFENPRKASQRAVFAALRTMENLIAKVVSECGGIIGAIPAGIKQGTKAGSALVATTALLLLVADIGKQIAPTITKTMGSSWMDTASKLISRHLEKTG